MRPIPRHFPDRLLAERIECYTFFSSNWWTKAIVAMTFLIGLGLVAVRSAAPQNVPSGTIELSGGHNPRACLIAFRSWDPMLGMSCPRSVEKLALNSKSKCWSATQQGTLNEKGVHDETGTSVLPKMRIKGGTRK